MLKPGPATEALNKLMIRYAQDGQLRNVATALAKGADVNYADGALVLTAAYLGKEKIVKLALRAGASAGLEKALEVAEQQNYTKIVYMLNEAILAQSTKLNASLKRIWRPM